MSPPNNSSRLSDSEVSDPDFDERGLANMTEKAKARAWARQEAASLSGMITLVN